MAKWWHHLMRYRSSWRRQIQWYLASRTFAVVWRWPLMWNLENWFKSYTQDTVTETLFQPLEWSIQRCRRLIVCTRVPTEAKTQIANLLATAQPAIKLNFMDVQMQSGGYDCGLFAIVFATVLVFGKQQGAFLFNQQKMRVHLVRCLEHRQMSMFPTKKRRRTGSKAKCVEEIQIYCICRMPELPDLNWIKCSSCKGWYHSDTC